MITINVDVGKQKPESIVLGRRGENLAREIVFDCASLEQEYGAGDATVTAVRADKVKYLPVITQAGSTVTWAVRSGDTSADGIGKVDVAWVVGEVIARTVTFMTDVKPSLDGTAQPQPPDPYKDWVDRMAEIGVQVEEDAKDAEQAKTDTEALLESWRSAGYMMFCKNPGGG